VQRVPPTEFAPGIISTGHEFGITFSQTGRQACFSRFTKGRATHILCSDFIHGSWRNPRSISFSDERWSDLDPFISYDGMRMFFISTRPNSGEPNVEQRMRIWVTHRMHRCWSEPHVVEGLDVAGKEGSPSTDQHGTLFFFVREQKSLENAIYTSRLHAGQYGAAARLPAPVNVAPSSTSPFISPDGQTLLFYSTRAGGEGGADLYVSFRNNGKWAPATNLGVAVNTSGSEYNPSVSPDGRELFFGRASRIYAIPLTAVPALRGRYFRASGDRTVSTCNGESANPFNCSRHR
jgi:hypothetical protein